ncbi:MAG: nucleotidyl transferase AbiEii/AbiGii toxin family protein [bacterium]
MQPKEDKTCYDSSQQREVLLELVRAKIIDRRFFLTGGTALAVFYLHHRTSNDLDFFTTQQVDLGEVDFTIKTIWPQDYRKIKDSQTFLSVLIHDVKVDFVIDPLSMHETRPRYQFELNLSLQIDSTSNIFSNKLTAMASRTEPKDFVDFYFLFKSLEVSSFEAVYQDASKKDAIFEDPPTAAYQIEQGLHFLLDNLNMLPSLRVEFERVTFTEFYHDLISWIYGKITPE